MTDTTAARPRIRVVTDTAADLPDSIATELAVVMVPLTIRFGTEEFVDRKDLSPQEFWRKVASSAVLPETAAPSPGAFETVFRQAAAEGCTGVVCVNLSSKLSATIESARLAARTVADVIPVRVVDSLSITMGLGTMVRRAAEAAAAGHSIDEVERAATSLVGRIRVYGALDTLDNLKKGGRIGGAQALIGSLLQVKPILDLSSGAVENPGKQRTRAKALSYLVSMVKEARDAHGAIADLAIMHGDAPDIDAFHNQLTAAFPDQQVIVAQIGAVIGAHGGPRVMGVAFSVPAAVPG